MSDPIIDMVRMLLDVATPGTVSLVLRNGEARIRLPLRSETPALPSPAPVSLTEPLLPPVPPRPRLAKGEKPVPRQPDDFTGTIYERAAHAASRYISGPTPVKKLLSLAGHPAGSWQRECVRHLCVWGVLYRWDGNAGVSLPPVPGDPPEEELRRRLGLPAVRRRRTVKSHIQGKQRSHVQEPSAIVG